MAGTQDDRNIFTVKNGFVYECFKGYPDEINNALLKTTKLHKQEHQLPINQSVQRIVALKVAGGIRAM